MLHPKSLALFTLGLATSTTVMASPFLSANAEETVAQSNTTQNNSGDVMYITEENNLYRILFAHLRFVGANGRLLLRDTRFD